MSNCEITVRLDENARTATLTEGGVEFSNEFVFTPWTPSSAEYQGLIAMYGLLGLLGTREREW